MRRHGIKISTKFITNPFDLYLVSHAPVSNAVAISHVRRRHDRHHGADVPLRWCPLKHAAGGLKALTLEPERKVPCWGKECTVMVRSGPRHMTWTFCDGNGRERNLPPLPGPILPMSMSGMGRYKGMGKLEVDIGGFTPAALVLGATANNVTFGATANNVTLLPSSVIVVAPLHCPHQRRTALFLRLGDQYSLHVQKRLVIYTNKNYCVKIIKLVQISNELKVVVRMC